MKQLAAAALLLGASICASAAADWVPIAEARNGAVFSIHPDRIRETRAGVLELWVRASSIKIEAVPGATHSMILYEIDCDGQKLRILQSTHYVDGQNPLSSSRPKGKLAAWVPESIGEVIARRVCTYRDEPDPKPQQ